jgi:hypothetical protein
MKPTIYLLVCLIFLTFSCSSDKGEAQDPASAILGTWEFSSLEVDEENTNTDLLLAKTYFIILLGQDCELVTFTFNEDATLVVESALNSLSTEVSFDGSSIPCPTDKEIEMASWSLEGDQLTIVDADGSEKTITIQLDGNKFTMSAESLSDGDYSGADAIFTKR